MKREIVISMIVSFIVFIILGGIILFLIQQSQTISLLSSPSTLREKTSFLTPTEKLAQPQEASIPMTLAKKTTSSPDRLVIINKTIVMEVKDVENSRIQVERLITEYNGYILNLTLSSADTQPVPMETKTDKITKAIIVIKVPIKNFIKFTQEVKKLGKLKSEFESSEEVTEQYIDLNARLKNLKREEERFLSFFDAAKNVKEMLEIERELSRIRGEIESLQAQVDHLEKSAKMATITLELSEPSPIVTPSGESWGFIEAIRKAIQNFVKVINFLIQLFGALLPFAILGFASYYLVKFWKKREELSKKS